MKAIEKRKVIDFNHIHKDINQDALEEYKSYYKIYHKKRYVFKKMYKMFKRRQLILNISSAIIGTSIVGTSIATHTIYVIGAGLLPILLQVYGRYKDYNIKYQACSYAYQKADAILIAIRNNLRSGDSDTDIILNMMNYCDEFSSEVCPPMICKFERQYDELYE